MRPPLRTIAVLAAAGLAGSALVGTAHADNGTDSAALRNAVTVASIKAHLQNLADIAAANGGTRAAGTSGYEASAAYVEARLQAAGYQTQRQAFSYDKYVENSPSEVAQVAPSPTVYGDLVDFASMSYSGTGDVTAAVTPVDLLLPATGGSTSGCEAADFAAFPAGNIALLQRGTCTFRAKADNAQAAGAAAVIIFNEGNTADRVPLFFGTLDAPQAGIPVVSASFARGQEWANTPGLRLRVAVDATVTPVDTFNVLADTPGGRSDRLTVVGAHLDSVGEGPGINDNGSGSATILDIAENMSGITPRNKVRFAFWGGEEDGLVGSTHYVDQLTKKQIAAHAVNLNFDMLGSPNAVRFVYDGDGSDGTAGPNGSDVVEDVFLDYFADQGLATEPTAFDGRSDYGPFIDAGIPAGGLFSGAEDLKTSEQAAIFGGVAGAPLDPCYHLACDTMANLSDQALAELSDGAAHAVLTFAMTTSAVNGTDKGKGAGKADLTYLADRAVK